MRRMDSLILPSGMPTSVSLSMACRSMTAHISARGPNFSMLSFASFSVPDASDPMLTVCPDCGAEVRKLFSAAAVGGSKSGFDDRAKAAGFHKLKRLGKGEFEKQY